MDNSLGLVPGQKYRVIKAFTDYDNQLHPVNECWIFIKTNFAPYNDGLTLHVKCEKTSYEIVYRFQWLKEAQADIIQNFNSLVETC